MMDKRLHHYTIQAALPERIGPPRTPPELILESEATMGQASTSTGKTSIKAHNNIEHGGRQGGTDNVESEDASMQ